MRIHFAGARDDRAVELLAALGDEIAAMGVEVAPSDEAVASPPEARDVTLFVPFAAAGAAFPADVDARRAIAICAEHPGSGDFDVATCVAAAAGGALTLSRAGALEQRRRGVSSQPLDLGMFARWWAPDPPPAAGRDREALFIGAHSSRRERLLAANAPSLARLRADIRIGSPWPGSRPLPSGAARRELLASAATVLDIHPRRPHGLDRVLALEAIGAGALPVFEHGLEAAPLVPGEHLAMVDGAQLGLVAADLLRRPGRLDQMVTAARAFASAELSPRPAVEAVLSLAEDVARRASRHERRRRVRLTPGRASRRARGRGDAAAPPSRARTRPAPLDGEGARADDGPALDDRGARAGGHPARADAARGKRAALLALDRRSQARARVLTARGLAGDFRREHESPAWASRRPPGLAVCVPVHDDGALAVEALESAVGSAGVDVELVVADDASIDGSLEVVRDWLLERPHVPSRLLASAVNRGVGAARNAMLADAAAPAAFMLDADNVLFPHGLARLASALDATPEAAFAYGLIERRRDGRPVGLLSAGPWEPERLRDGNYIDAMALLRREQVLAAGGFCDDRRLYGWEDFDLWCRLAEHGRHGAFVPGFVGCYRERRGSMLAISELDTSDAVALLRERAPRLLPSIPLPAGVR